MPLSFALSITHFVSSVGADAGFAALIGLAILVLLYFAHARETSNLRKALEDANQRLADMERRLAPAVGARQPVGAAEAARPAVAPAPATSAVPGVPAVAPTVAPRPVPAAPVAAPAGVGAPPLSDATRVVPGVQEEQPEGAPSDGHGAGPAIPAAPPTASPAAETKPSPLTAGAPLTAAASPAVGKTPSPVTAAAGGNGSSAARSAGAAGGPHSLLEHGIPGQKKRTKRWLLPVLALVAAAIIAAVVVVLVLRSSSSNHATAAHRHHAPAIAAAPRSVAPSTVTVALVNGTNVNQLAHHIGARLTKQGFKEGTLATATNQTGTKTTVGYLPGQRDEALAVAHYLKLPASAVAPASHGSEALVCPTASSCTADVVVVVGSNLAPKS